MKRLPIVWMLLTMLLVACRAAGPIPSPLPVDGPTATATRPLLNGTLLPTSTYQAQAIGANLVAGSTVSLIDPATNQVKGTGVSASDGTFTVMALPSFTPTLNTLYVLEAERSLGNTNSGLLRLRTLVSLGSTGWTSITGSTVTIGTMTTAVSLLYRLESLSAANVLSKVTYDATTRRSTPSALSAALSDVTVRQVDVLVQRALAANLDPMRSVQPSVNGGFTIGEASSSVNLLPNGGFEQGSSTPTSWGAYGTQSSVMTVATDATTCWEGNKSCKLTVASAGDAWFGTGFSANPTYPAIPLVAGQTYTFSVYAKGAVGGEQLTFREAQVINGVSSEYGSPIATLTTAFQRYSWTFTATNSVSVEDLFFRLFPASTYPFTVWLDGAQLEVGSTPTSYGGSAGHLLYDSTTTPNSGSSTFTYGPGHNGGTGLVLDSGINLVSNGHAQNGTTGYSLGGGTLGTTSTYRLPANCPGTQAFSFTHDNTTNWNFAYTSVTVQPNTNYTASVWLYLPSTADPLSTNLSFSVGNSNVGSVFAYINPPTQLDKWYQTSFTFNSGANSTVLIYPADTNTANAQIEFTMLQIEQGTVAHPYTGGQGLDRYTIDPRYIPRAAGSIEYWFQPFYDSSDNRYDYTGGNSMMGISTYLDWCILTFNKQGNTLCYGIHDACAWHYTYWTPSTPLWSAMSWHHVAMTWGDPSGMKLYFDGRQVVSSTYNGGLFNQTGCQLGPASALGCLYLSGQSGNQSYMQNATVDQLRIYDYPRADADIARDYLGVQIPAGL